MADELGLTHVGGPTVVVDYLGLRLVTDPTFDPAASTYPLGPVTLTKTAGPAVPAADLGRIDVVLLSHDQHADNFDAAGRAVAARAGRVLTTPAGAGRLGGHATGLGPWQTADLPAPGGRTLRVTATPARHGPAGCEPVTGDVTGFVLTPDGAAGGVYVTGDTVWFDGVAEVARRFPGVRLVVLSAGAARVAVAGPAHLTMEAADAVATARAFPEAVIVPVHCDQWAHFTEGRAEIDAAFAAAGLGTRLRWLAPSIRTKV